MSFEGFETSSRSLDWSWSPASRIGGMGCRELSFGYVLRDRPLPRSGDGLALLIAPLLRGLCWQVVLDEVRLVFEDDEFTLLWWRGSSREA